MKPHGCLIETPVGPCSARGHGGDGDLKGLTQEAHEREETLGPPKIILANTYHLIFAGGAMSDSMSRKLGGSFMVRNCK